MIKKFSEYLKEGLWKSGIERSKTLTKRLGDMTLLDKVLTLSDEKKKKIIIKFKDLVFWGYDMIWDEVCDVFKLTNKYSFEEAIQNFTYDEILTKSFNIIEKYGVKFKQLPNNFYRKVEEVMNDESIEEGLWKSGIERSKTGAKRIGDLNCVDKLRKKPQTIPTTRNFIQLLMCWDESTRDAFMKHLKIEGGNQSVNKWKDFIDSYIDSVFSVYSLDELWDKICEFLDTLGEEMAERVIGLEDAAFDEH